MTKKKQQRKPNVSLDALERARRELAEDGSVIPAAIPQTGVATARSATAAKAKIGETLVVRSSGGKKHTVTAEELSQEYGYVLKDLRSMATLALALFVGMIVVSLVLNQLI
jgi:hypothetical protein